MLEMICSLKAISSFNRLKRLLTQLKVVMEEQIVIQERASTAFMWFPLL